MSAAALEVQEVRLDLPALEAERVHVRHPGAARDALRDLSLCVMPGEIVALVGPNGSGKSSLLAAFGGELPGSGRVLQEELGSAAYSIVDRSGRPLARTLRRIDLALRGVRRNNDRRGYDLAGEVLAGDHAWVEDGTAHSEM